MRAVLYDQSPSDAVTALCKATEWPPAEQNLDALAQTLFNEMLKHATSDRYGWHFVRQYLILFLSAIVTCPHVRSSA